MVHHEKSAFLKFFLTYFISVALLILASGFFYFEQMKLQLVKSEHFSLIEYARHIKMGENLKSFSKDYHHRYVYSGKHIDIRNFNISENEFTKLIPTTDPHRYLQVFKSKKPYEENIAQLRLKIIMLQLLLLAIFALISYFLAKNALKPMQESIKTLDSFAKDLIHDLNTPVTAMKLNIKLLQKEPCLESKEAFIRLEKSVNTISELHVSLTTLLEKKTFQVRKVNVCTVVHDVVELHQPNYPHLDFYMECGDMEVLVNEHAIKQVLHNIISNACKYNKKGGFVKIYTQQSQLCIQDSGTGISEPKKIFDREYSAQNSSGLGLDIAKRLCDSMSVTIDVESDAKGSCFTLKFPKEES